MIRPRTLAIAILAAACVSLLAAQAGAAPPPKAVLAELRGLVKQLSLTDDQLGKLERLVEESGESLAKARADLEIAKARLARLLMERKPDMDAVRAVLRESLEIEYRIRLAQVERNISARTIAGEENWAVMVRISTLLRPLLREGRLDGELEGVFKEDPSRLRMLRIIVRLFW